MQVFIEYSNDIDEIYENIEYIINEIKNKKYCIWWYDCSYT